MSVFGDGSNGALNVTSGTTNLNLDTRYQYTTVNVSSGAFLSTTSTTGSVLFIDATTSITIDGTINVAAKVNAGQNSWSATIDGVTYVSPSAANGGAGGSGLIATGGTQGSGFGGGGAGGDVIGYSGGGGTGGTGGTPGGSGGSAVTVTSSAAPGNAGGVSSGGSGAAFASGTVTSGAGGNSYGSNGGNGGGNGSSTISGGGGGAGGSAGRPGVHVILRAPTIVIYGTVITSGTAGGNGGNGGSGTGYAVAGAGGGGGAGGSAGNIYLTYDSLSTHPYHLMVAGSGGSGGSGYVSGSAGASGLSGSLVPTSIIRPDSTTNTSTMGSPTITQLDPPPPPAPDWSALGKEDEKKYVYKVYKADGTYVGVWNDVKDLPEFTQKINTPGTTMTVHLVRSANTTVEKRDVLTTQDGEVITDQGGDPIALTYTTNNTVGTDSDVELNYNVDIYVIYGGYEMLVTQDGEPITTQDGEQLVVEYGAPNGVRVFSGYIMDYESVYGESAGVAVTLASHGAGLSQELVRSGTTTTVTFISSTTLEAQVKSILDTNPGKLTYSSDSISATGVTDASKLVLNTKLEAIQSVFERSPAGWYWYGNVSDNYLYLKPLGGSVDHTFKLGYHIKSLTLRRSIEQIRNAVYFVGGELTPGDATTTVYKYYQDTASQTAWRRAIYRITDRRYTVGTSMQKRADKEMSQFKAPVYVTSVVISSAKYDLESIKLGQTVGFRNFNNDIDQLTLQVISLQYTPTALTLGLGMMLDTTGEMAADLEQRLQDESTQNIPDTPS